MIAVDLVRFFNAWCKFTFPHICSLGNRMSVLKLSSVVTFIV
jgi:hypothetical protein